jgi:hypothetical protein
MNRRSFLSVVAAPIVALTPVHHWYEEECCSDKDCEELPNEAVSAREHGYWVNYINYAGYAVTGLVPYAKVRPSHDEKYHACSIGYSIICLYVPMTT